MYIHTYIYIYGVHDVIICVVYVIYLLDLIQVIHGIYVVMQHDVMWSYDVMRCNPMSCIVMCVCIYTHN